MTGAPARAVLAEFLGTAMLLTVVIGSGVMAQRLSGGNDGIALLANALATVGGLFALIEIFASVSGAHFNPAVSIVLGAAGRFRWRSLPAYVFAQLAGGVLGAGLAHAMFDLPIVEWSSKVRGGWGQWIGEGVATAGLMLVVLRAAPQRASALVSAYIGSAYWFTSSTSFANPAAAVGRMLSDTFAGIAPLSVPGFVAAELLGAAVGFGVHAALEGAHGSRWNVPWMLGCERSSDIAADLRARAETSADQ